MKWTRYEILLPLSYNDGRPIEPADDSFRKYKEILKARFQQIDIWISSHEIQIL